MKKSFAMMLTAALTTTSVCGFAFADEAANDPYGKYDELVTYTTGYSLTNQGADVLAGTPYENDTPENNAYTRYLKELLNIQNENDFEATMGDDYNQKLALAIASQSLPDIIHVPDYSTLVELVENDMIEDLTDVYNNLACDTVKESYESYGDNNPLNTVTFDGKIMAIPKTQLSDGQDFLWVRKDWLDKLGLEEPSTMDEVADVLRAFINDDPDGDGEADTIGLAMRSDVYGEYPNNTFGDELSYYQSAQNYLAAEKEGKKADSSDYSQYMSRIVSMSRMIENPADFVTPAFYETTESMAIRWASLEKIEMQTVLKIIVGEESIDAFDKFVSDWNNAGGEMITEEVNEAIQK